MTTTDNILNFRKTEAFERVQEVEQNIFNRDPLNCISSRHFKKIEILTEQERLEMIRVFHIVMDDYRAVARYAIKQLEAMEFDTPEDDAEPQSPAVEPEPQGNNEKEQRMEQVGKGVRGDDPKQVAKHFAEMLEQWGEQVVSEDRVMELISETLSSMPSHKVEITKIDGTTIELDEHRHPMFEKVLRLVSAGLNVLMVGPAGTGKTHLANQVSRALDCNFGSISCTAGASESQLVGRFLPTGENGRFEYTGTTFLDIYENGGVFLFDEIDAADPNMLLIVNSALSNGGFFNDLRTEKPEVSRHENARIIGAANTFGTGADVIYTGRGQLDAATLDRWYVVELDYDSALESLIAGDVETASKWKPDNSEMDTAERKELLRWVRNIRKKVESNGLMRVASTRMLQKGIAARAAGVPLNEVKEDLLAGWSRDERAKVGE